MKLLLNCTALAKLLILAEELFDARDKLQFLFGRQLLVLIQEQLEFVLEPFNQLVQGDLILVVHQFCELLHSPVCLVAFKHH